MICPSCRAENAPDAKFCESCGAGLVPPSGSTRISADHGSAAATGDGARAVVNWGTYIEQLIVQIQPRLAQNPQDRFQIPFGKPEHFVGRDSLLRELHQRLQSAARPLGLTGLGGIGKTQLAVAYALEHTQEFPDGIFWLSAADPRSWLSEVSTIASRLGLLPPDPNASDAMLFQAAALAAYLKQHPAALFILDNVEDPGDLANEIVPALNFSALPCRVLFTARACEPTLPLDWLAVPALDPDAALDLLLQHDCHRPVRQPNHPEHPAAVALCRAMHHLPLLLVVIGKYLAQDDEVSFSGMLERVRAEGLVNALDGAASEGNLTQKYFTTRHSPLLSFTLAQSWDKLDGLQRRILLALAQLEEALPVARATLCLYCGLSDLAAPGKRSPLGQHMLRLRQFAMLEELEARQVRLHPLIRDFARARAEPGLGAWMAGNTALALSDPARLESELCARGVDSLLRDLRAVCALAPQHAQANCLLRALDHEAHTLRGDLQAQETGYLLQQWRNRCFEEGLEEAREACELLLAQRGARWLKRLHHTETGDPAWLRTLAGHTGAVNDVALSADGRTAVSASDDHTLKVWDVQIGTCLRTLQKDEECFTSVALSADGRLAVSASEYYILQLWDLQSGICLRTMQGDPDEVNNIALSADGRTVISASDDYTLIVWDVNSDYPLRTMEGHTDNVNCVALSADGRTAVSASHDRTLKVWDVSSGACLRTLRGHTLAVLSVALSADAHMAISIAWDSIKVWDVNSGDCLRTLQGHTKGAKFVNLSADGRTAVSACGGGIKVWDVQSGVCLRTIQEDTSSVALSADGCTAVSTSDDDTLKVWDVTAKGACLRTLQGHTYSVTRVALSGDGRTAVSASDDHTLKVWDVNSGACLRKMEGHTKGVKFVILSADGRTAVSASWDETLKVWDVQSGIPLRTMQGYSNMMVSADNGSPVVNDVLSIALSADGRTAVSGSSFGIIDVWDVNSGACLRTLQGHTDFVDSVALSTDGRTAVSVSWRDETIKVWDVNSGACLRTLQGHTDFVNSVALSADGRTAVSASDDHTLKVWDVNSGACLLTMEGHTDDVNFVALSADGRTAVSASDDHTLKVWEVSSGTCLITLSANARFISYAVSRDARRVAAWDAGGLVHFYDWMGA